MSIPIASNADATSRPGGGVAGLKEATAFEGQGVGVALVVRGGFGVDGGAEEEGGEDEGREAGSVHGLVHLRGKPVQTRPGEQYVSSMQ
jgi:hypothetical protein